MYSAEISRRNPSCFLLLIDQSDSMKDPFGGGEGRTKAQGTADAINRLLQNLVLRCTKPEGVRDYYDVGVIGYGAKVGPAFSGPLAGRELVPISEVADNPARVETRKREDGAGGVVDFRLPIYFDAVAANGTPMSAALKRAHTLLQKWVLDHADSYPPVVINLTDGEATDGDPMPIAEQIKGLTTNDGNVLVFNCHMSSKKANPILFPDGETVLPDEHAQRLFEMSSELPPGILDAAKNDGFKVGSNARGFAFNAELVDVIRFIDIGTRSTTSLR